MTNFVVYKTDTAPAASRALLEGIERSFGFIPNLFGVFPESPAALRGALAFHEAFSTSSLSPAERQLVMLVVSEANECEYCVAAHSTLAKRLAKVDPALVDAVRVRARLADDKLDALVTFTRKVVDERGWLADAEVDEFLNAGYTREQVLDVLLGVGMKTFNNYVDHIAHAPLNDQFKAEAWQPTRRVG